MNNAVKSQVNLCWPYISTVSWRLLFFCLCGARTQNRV